MRERPGSTLSAPAVYQKHPLLLLLLAHRPAGLDAVLEATFVHDHPDVRTLADDPALKSNENAMALQQELLVLFEKQSASLLALASDRSAERRRRADAAHQLKGSALALGAGAVARAAAAVEAALAADADGSEAAESALAALAAAVEAALAALAGLRG